MDGITEEECCMMFCFRPATHALVFGCPDLHVAGFTYCRDCAEKTYRMWAVHAVHPHRALEAARFYCHECSGYYTEMLGPRAVNA